jgi:hypothetical protein
MGRIGGVGLPSRASMFEDLLEHEMFEPHPRARDDGLEIELTMGKRGRSPNWTVCCCQDVAICTASMDETQTHAMRCDAIRSVVAQLDNYVLLSFRRDIFIFAIIWDFPATGQHGFQTARSAWCASPRKKQRAVMDGPWILDLGSWTLDVGPSQTWI